ncbi:hypothetical protein B0A55_01563 [Friedmanniomyces simplex]|uniref:Cytochrome b561 domain-containing protein n=1 Tax=Friedmanniomyces simplex TaxID=329884 RepID=A0A4U0XY92_9PEZI|nr:hypothetical protein B0A55_01563 [Friedmanniomyces simplex]
MANLSPAGSSTYSSNTLHVGDGTWDSGRDDFLLPNLVGLNFATMQYNGMGNRFRELPGYHRLILGHGVLAAITFIGILPAAIFVAKFYRSNPRMAVKLHVYLQILTVFLATVVLVLGWFAVGPERSLTNPHHGIGVAIYVCVLMQFLYGWLMARIEKRRKDPMALTRTPTKVWIHKLFGRSIALLAFVQVALGLTLYGSPKALFVLYALAGALLVFLYLVLDRWHFEKRPVMFGLDNGPEFYSDYGSYLSGSRMDYRSGAGQGPPPREGDRSHWGRNILGAVGAAGAYEAYKRRSSERRDRREGAETEGERRERMEQEEMDAEQRRRPPPPGMAPSGVPSSRPSSRPPPGVMYGAGNVPVVGPMGGNQRPPSQTPNRMRAEESRLSPESWEENEKYSERPQRHSWRDRLLGAGAGVAAFEGVRRVFSRKRRDEDYVDDNYRPPHGGAHNMVSQTDVSRVEAGQVPMSPDDPRRRERMNIAGVQPMTPTATPSRSGRRPAPSADSLSYDDDESVMEPRPGPQHIRQDDDSHTLRNSITTMGAIAGFREWNKHRKERQERQRQDRMRQQELNDQSVYDRRTSTNYPRPQDAGGRRPSVGGTVTTGTEIFDPGFSGSNPELSRNNFRPDTMQPPLPATAGAMSSMNQQRFTENTQNYQLPPPPAGPPLGGIRPENLPPPPAGPPPGGFRSADYRPLEPGSLQMPQGAIEPDPSRLMSSENVTHQSSSSHPVRDTAAGAIFGAAAADLASGRRRNSQSQSPSRYHSRQDSHTRLQRRERRGSTASGSVSQINTNNAPSTSNNDPTGPVAVKVKMHTDGKHVTLRRLSEQEADAERQARRTERRSRRRRSSEVSSGGIEDDLPPGSNQRYRRNGKGVVRRSSDQPIANVPPPPPMSSTAGSHRPPSELNLPPATAGASGARPPGVPSHSISPQDGQGLSSPPAPGMMSGSGMTSPGEGGDVTGTDVSAFDNNRRRRRAERARRLEAARGGGRSVDFT